MKKIITYSSLTLALFFFFQFLVEVFALSSVAVVGIDAIFDRDANVSVYYSSGIAGKGFSETKVIKTGAFIGNERSYKRVFLKNNVARKLRIDPGDSKGEVKIFKIIIDSHFGKKHTLYPNDIKDKFIPSGDTVSIEKEHNYILVKSSGNDPQILAKEDIYFNNKLLKSIFPLILALITVVIVYSTSFKSLYAFRDINNGKSTSTGVKYKILDGIRGIAALMVLCEHVGIFPGIGRVGVYLFFTLSGFLLSIPFIYQKHDENLILYLKTYTLRRVMRIVPMYYFLITLFYLFRGKEYTALRHYLFLQGDIHLWTIPQEMLFYLLLPGIILACQFISRKNNMITAFLLLGIIFLSNMFLTKEVFSLFVYNNNMRFLLGIFLSGVFFSYIYHWIIQTGWYIKFKESNFPQLVSIVAIVTLVGVVICAMGKIEAMKPVDSNFELYGFFCASIIFLALISDNTKTSTIFSILPFRAVGIVGFSFYLLHPFVLWSLQGFLDKLSGSQLNSLPMLFIAGTFSYILASFTYSLIERPFLIKNTTC